MLALPLGDNEENIVYTKFTLCDAYRKTIEPAGRPFEEYLQKRLMNENGIDDLVQEEEDDAEIIEEDKEEYEWEKEYKANTKNSDVIFSGKDNFYAILGIEDLFLNATTDDIRRAYKKLALIYHPDKNKENISLDNDNEENKNMPETNYLSNVDEEGNVLSVDESKLSDEEKKKIEINRKWLKIKEAYETLLDEEKKKKYDSTFEFDDAIPAEYDTYSEKRFFSSFGPCFLKNSIWSKRKPIPKIGDMNTPLDKVNQFYRFWTNFQTWRDFSVEGEYNLEDASCRYEKRQMLKENKKMKSSMVKEEKARLLKLVNIAYKNDPRIQMENEKIRVEKEKIRIERLLQKQKEKEEDEERAKLVKRQYEENLKKQQEMLVKEREDLKNSLINLAPMLSINLSSDDKFQILLNGKSEIIKTILNEIESKQSKNEKAAAFKTMTKSYFSLKFADDKITPDESSIWKKEEIHALQKAVKKWPAGTIERWDKIGEIIKTKSSSQMIQMTHYLTTNPSIKIDGDIDMNTILNKKTEKKVSDFMVNKETKEQATPVKSTDEESWSEEQQKALELALKKFPSSMSANERWTKIAGEVTGKTKKQCVDRYKYLSSMIKKK